MSGFTIPNDTRSLIVLAKVAEQCLRYDEMLVYMKKAVSLKPVLTTEEKNLLAVAYKNVLGARRAPWRTLQSLPTQAGAEAVQLLKARIMEEIGEVCTDMFTMLESHLIPAAKDDVEAQVFYLKLKADYHRYYVEVLSGGSHAELEKKQHALAHQTYTTAMETAAQLDSRQAIRLGLELNYSVFLYEIEKKQEEGYNVAKAALERVDFGHALGDLGDDDYRESATIVALLNDNLTTWAKAMGYEDTTDAMAVEEA